jgi:hypothetical protein
MRFDPIAYGDAVARLLALEENGNRLIPLVAGGGCSTEAERILRGAQARDLFPRAIAPAGALAGLWLYFSCFEEAHSVAQDDGSTEGSFWHAILHRQEPDSGNSAYWFRRVGSHPVFPALATESADIARRYPEAGLRPSERWDPLEFIHFCERARQQPGSPAEAAALEIQRAEWQLLFDHCAREETRDSNKLPHFR